MKKTLWMSAALCSALAAGAFAQQASMAGKQGGGKGKGGACAQDAQTLCANAEKGGKFACLANNLSKVQNAKCKERVEKYQTKNNGVKQACSSDISSDKCGGLDIGTGLLKCLGKNRKTLSAGCKSELKSIRGKRGGKAMGKGKGGGQSEESESEGEGEGDEPPAK